MFQPVNAQTTLAVMNEPINAVLYFVDADASGAATGLTWTDAFTTLQDALAIALSGDQIWVAEGIYYPDEGVGQTNNVVTSTFSLTSSVAIYGGFDPGSNVDEFSERNWRIHPTVLSGDIDQNDFTDAHGIITTTDHLSGANAHNVVFGLRINENTVLDGFFITAGSTPTDGGGMYNFQSSPTLRNLAFTGNKALHNGGGMFNINQSSPQLTNVSFTRNTADYRGGAISNMSDSNPILTNVILSDNWAVNRGGGIFNRDSSPFLINVTIANNTADGKAGGIYNWDSSSPTLTNTILWGNRAINGDHQILNAFNSTSTISHSDIEDSNGSGVGWDSALGNDGGGNIDTDPQFAKDYDDLHLSAGSPAIDTGTNSACPPTDFDYLIRPIGLVCDMGAYEFGAFVYIPLLIKDTP